MTNFVKKQIKQIKKYGVKNRIRIALRYLFPELLIVLIFQMYLILIIVRLIRPVKLIRFGNLYSERIGHLSLNNELYMCECDHSMQPRNSTDIFGYLKPVCNNQLLKMWKRVLPAKINRIAYYVWWLNNIIPGGDKHVIRTANSDRDIHGLMEKSEIHLYFTQEEEAEARAGLRKMGIKNGTPFVCLAVRDSAYLEKHYSGRDFSYHSYRNCNIQNYRDAAEMLVDRGFTVVRMGSVVEETMQTHNPRIIEYASRGFRTELLDIYLSAKCSFFINGMAGIQSLPMVFRRPIIHTEHVPFEYVMSWSSKSITIFMKYWLKNERRLMTFREIIESGAGRYLYTQQYEEHGIQLIDNTPEEITAVTMEMYERLKGTWQTTEEDEELQRRFWSLIKSNKINRVVRSRVGTEFLRQHRELL